MTDPLRQEYKYQLLRRLAKDEKVWSLDDFVEYIDAQLQDRHSKGVELEIPLCNHGVAAIRLICELEAEREKNQLLLERMEDLCAEMETVQEKHGTFIMGPGVTTDVED